MLAAIVFFLKLGITAVGVHGLRHRPFKAQLPPSMYKGFGQGVNDNFQLLPQVQVELGTVTQFGEHRLVTDSDKVRVVTHEQLAVAVVDEQSVFAAGDFRQVGTGDLRKYGQFHNYGPVLATFLSDDPRSVRWKGCELGRYGGICEASVHNSTKFVVFGIGNPKDLAVDPARVDPSSEQHYNARSMVYLSLTKSFMGEWFWKDQVEGVYNDFSGMRDLCTGRTVVVVITWAGGVYTGGDKSFYHLGRPATDASWKLAPIDRSHVSLSPSHRPKSCHVAHRGVFILTEQGQLVTWAAETPGRCCCSPSPGNGRTTHPLALPC